MSGALRALCKVPVDIWSTKLSSASASVDESRQNFVSVTGRALRIAQTLSPLVNSAQAGVSVVNIEATTMQGVREHTSCPKCAVAGHRREVPINII